ncbi:hypothetical protein WH8501_04900 [Crocosphaera watsonii WH 8501]|uniref:Uncharacterized protein n=1 Tax=Crocosphaera watsonii WH 8501 TaxID=165597 RepID=Q4BUH0_CROWT|nr:hypothetical protein [Crocosphaera watsonii]EAM47550.1 hypothetical protein CwatDRAFT_0097 [Crocosphaera watsonii WH 8501]
MTEREFETIIDKLTILENNDKMLAERLEFYSEKLDLYKQVSDEKLEVFKKSSDEQINAIRSEIKGYQDANKQQLNVSLGVLVIAAVAILVSVILSMNN